MNQTVVKKKLKKVTLTRKPATKKKPVTINPANRPAAPGTILPTRPVSTGGDQ